MLKYKGKIIKEKKIKLKTQRLFSQQVKMQEYI